MIQPWTTVPEASPGFTDTVKVVAPLAGTVTEAGKLIRLSAEVVVPASNGMRDALVLGVNFNAASEKVWDMPLESVSDKANGCGWVLELLTIPKLAESGSNQIVAFAALVRFSRPAP